MHTKTTQLIIKLIFNVQCTLNKSSTLYSWFILFLYCTFSRYHHCIILRWKLSNNMGTGNIWAHLLPMKQLFDLTGKHFHKLRISIETFYVSLHSKIWIKKKKDLDFSFDNVAMPFLNFNEDCSTFLWI